MTPVTKYEIIEHLPGGSGATQRYSGEDEHAARAIWENVAFGIFMSSPEPGLWHHVDYRREAPANNGTKPAEPPSRAPELDSLV